MRFAVVKERSRSSVLKGEGVLSATNVEGW